MAGPMVDQAARASSPTRPDMLGNILSLEAEILGPRIVTSDMRSAIDWSLSLHPLPAVMALSAMASEACALGGVNRPASVCLRS
jgi:hypothetical protein